MDSKNTMTFNNSSHNTMTFNNSSNITMNINNSSSSGRESFLSTLSQTEIAEALIANQHSHVQHAEKCAKTALNYADIQKRTYLHLLKETTAQLQHAEHQIVVYQEAIRRSHEKCEFEMSKELPSFGSKTYVKYDEIDRGLYAELEKYKERQTMYDRQFFRYEWMLAKIEKDIRGIEKRVRDARKEAGLCCRELRKKYGLKPLGVDKGLGESKGEDKGVDGRAGLETTDSRPAEPRKNWVEEEVQDRQRAEVYLSTDEEDGGVPLWLEEKEEPHDRQHAEAYLSTDEEDGGVPLWLDEEVEEEEELVEGDMEYPDSVA